MFVIPRDAPLLVDLDGTLVDSIEDIRASLNHVRARVGLPEAPLDAVRDMIGDGARTLLDRGLAHGTPDAVEPATLLRWFVAHHQHQCTVHATPYPGVLDTLRQWRHEARVVAVVTNKPEALARRLLDHLEMADLVDAVVGGDTTKERKPDPLPLHHALDLLNASPGTTPWMIGDGIPDLRAGRAAGARTLAVTYGYRDAQQLALERPDFWWSQFGGPVLETAPTTRDPRSL